MNRYLSKIAEMKSVPIGETNVKTMLTTNPAKQLKHDSFAVNGTVRLQKDKPETIAKKF